MSTLYDKCLLRRPFAFTGIVVSLLSFDAPAAQSPVRPAVIAPSAIDATGQSDVTDDLLAFLASVPDGGTVRLPAGAQYRVEGTLILENRHNLTIEGNGALLFATTTGENVTPPRDLEHKWPRKRAHLVVYGGGGIVVRNLQIRGPHRNGGENGDYVRELEGQHGIVLRGVQGAELDRVRITDVYGDFVYLGSYGGAGSAWTRNVRIHDSHFERNGRQGFGITGAEDILLENNYIGDVRRTALDIEPNGVSGGAKRLTVRKNTFGAIGNHWLAGHGKVGTVEDITLEENVVHDKMRVSTNPTGPRRRNFRIVNNTSDQVVGLPIALMTLHLIDGIVVRGNKSTFSPAREMTGVHVTQSCSVDIGGNTFTGALKEFEIKPFVGCR
jgi:hypothetical protein